MTTPTIKEIADGLSEAQRRAILRAKKVGVDFQIRRGSGRGLMNAGLTWRYLDCTLLTETGLQVRAHLQQEQE